jgi:WD40 repeat protein
VLAEGNGLRVFSADGTRISSLLLPEGELVQCMSLSADGRRLLTAGVAPIIRCWDVDTGELVAAWPDPMGGIRCLAWRRDGGQVVSSGTDRVIRVRDAASGEVVREETSPGRR